MSAVTLAQLRQRALDYADMTGSDFPDKSRVADYINAGLSELYDLLVNNYADEYVRRDTTFSVTSSSESYALPADFYKAIALYHQVSSRRHKIERWQPTEISGARTAPLSSGTVEMWYVPQPPTLASDKERIPVSIPTGWADFVALHAAVRLLIREESDPSALMAERDRQKARIIAMVSPRDNAEPDSIGDFYGRWDQGFSALAVEPSYKYRIMGDRIYFIEVEYRGV